MKATTKWAYRQIGKFANAKLQVCGLPPKRFVWICCWNLQRFFWFVYTCCRSVCGLVLSITSMLTLTLAHLWCFASYVSIKRADLGHRVRFNIFGAQMAEVERARWRFSRPGLQISLRRASRKQFSRRRRAIGRERPKHGSFSLQENAGPAAHGRDACLVPRLENAKVWILDGATNVWRVAARCFCCFLSPPVGRPDGMGTVTLEEQERFRAVRSRLMLLLENQIAHFR